MASKAELEVREANCKTVEDYCKLAMEALSDPKDEVYAKELLDSAESDCSLPYDYIFVAEVYAKMGNKDSAEEMYQEAEDSSFEPMEIAALGHSIAVYLADKDKAKELLENAAKDAKKINEILTISNYVQSDLNDSELVKQLLAKVEGNLKNLQDYKNLAETIIKDSGDLDTAKSLFVKAANKINGIEETVQYADAIMILFGDKNLASGALEEVEDDAQFTKDYVLLAQGFKALGDEEKAKELMETGKDFALAAEEHIDLATGYWRLFNDKNSASESYQKGLSDLSDKEKLLAYAKIIALDLGNNDLAKKYYERAESKMSSAKDLTKLAQAVIDDLKDKDYAKGIYMRAEKSIEDPGELMLLASDIIKNLNDKEKAKDVYKNTLTKIEKFPVYIELFDNVIAKIDDKTFGKEILETVEKMAGTTPELLQITLKALDVLYDKEFAEQILEKAEEVVTNLNEMKDVNKTVKDKFIDKIDWIKRVDEKLDKREKNQDKYEAYQKREGSAKTFKDLRLIVDEMMAELDDKYYAQKLLHSAEDKLNTSQYNIENYRKLIQSISKYLKDSVWINNILDNIFETKAQFHFDYCGICKLAIEEIPDKVTGKKLVETYLKKYEEKIDTNPKKTAYNYTDLAKAVWHNVNDSSWSLNLLDKAEQSGADFFAYAYMGHLAGVIGKNSAKEKYFNFAVEKATTGNDFQNLAQRLKALNVDAEEIRILYAQGSKMTKPEDKLLWAEGIADILEDKKWAEKVYKQISSAFHSDNDKEIFESSRKIRLEGKFW